MGHITLRYLPIWDLFQSCKFH